MNQGLFLPRIEQIGTGVAFILFPLIFVFAFAVHPGLLSPRLLGPEEIIQRARQNGLLQLGHAFVLLSSALLVVIALHFFKVLNQGPYAWFGFVGAALAVIGAVLLAADKGAFCLTMSAYDTLPNDKFASMMPGLMAMFTKQGWMVLLWGILCLPFGFSVQAIGLLKSGAMPKWQSILFLIGALLVGTPDGMEIVNLSASVLMAISLVPYGIQLIAAAL